MPGASIRLVSANAGSIAAFEPDAFDLSVQPTRPGTSHCELVLEVPPGLAEEVRQSAAREGLPPEAWAGFVIESERVLHFLGGPREQFLERLDTCAHRQGMAIPGGAQRLAEFAKALRATPARDPGRVRRLQTTVGRLPVLAPYRSISAWRGAAIEARQSMDEWAAAMLAVVPTGRPLWEAAAAERGETLAEWIFAQATRR